METTDRPREQINANRGIPEPSPQRLSPDCTYNSVRNVGEGGGFQQYVAGVARNIQLTLLGPEGPTDFQIHSARTSIFSEPTGIVN